MMATVEKAKNTVFDPLKDFQVYPRKWISLPGHESNSSDDTFSIVTYNILGDTYIRDQYTHIEEQYRYMPCRHPRMMKELQSFNSDIVCMQEVDLQHYNDRVAPDLRKLGYNSEYHDQCDDQGKVVAYKPEKFQLVDVKFCVLAQIAETALQTSELNPTQQNLIHNTLNEFTQGMLVVKLKCLKTGKVLTLGNTHILWGDLKKQDIQVIQTAAALKELVHFAGGADKPHIITGDFNSPPHHPGYHLLKDGQLKKQLIDSLHSPEVVSTSKNGFLVDLLQGSLCHTSKLKSAYFTVMGREPPITNRDDASPEGVFADCLDYLWYSDNTIQTVGVLETPPEDSLCEVHVLPNYNFPSDHIPLMAGFKFKE